MRAGSAPECPWIGAKGLCCYPRLCAEVTYQYRHDDNKNTFPRSQKILAADRLNYYLHGRERHQKAPPPESPILFSCCTRRPKTAFNSHHKVNAAGGLALKKNKTFILMYGAWILPELNSKPRLTTSARWESTIDSRGTKCGTFAKKTVKMASGNAASSNWATCNAR